jgi:O-antigen/teichoic acid export membrane protein
VSDHVATPGMASPADDVDAEVAAPSLGRASGSGRNLRQSAVSGALWSFAESWTNQFLQLIIFIVLARYLHPHEFGLVATAMLFCQLFQNTFLAGVSTPLIRMTNNDRAADDTGFTLAAGLGLLMAALLFASADWLEGLYAMPGLAALVRVLSVGSLLSSLAVAQQAWMIRNLRFRPLALRTMLATGTGGVISVLLAMNGFGAMSLAAYYLTSALLGLIVLWSCSPWRPAFAWARGPARDIARYGRHVSATGAINFANENSDVLVIGYVLGPSAAGIYVVGKRAFIAANALLAGALSRLAVPVFSQIHGDPPRLAAAFLSAIKTTSIVTTPAFAGLALVAPEFLMLFFGPQWLAATSVMQALCIVGIIQSLGLYNHALMLALGKPGWQTRLTLLYAVVNLAAFALVARFGIGAVALAFAARAYLLYPLSVAPVMRLIPVSVPTYLGALRTSVIATAVMAAGVILLRGIVQDWPVLLRLLALIAAGGALYAASLFAIGRKDLGELCTLWSSLRKAGRA